MNDDIFTFSTTDLQRRLRDIAEADQSIPKVAVDGLYGPETSEAVRQFQSLFGLPATGEVDENTWRAIGEAHRLAEVRATPPRSVRLLRHHRESVTPGEGTANDLILSIMLDKIGERFVNLAGDDRVQLIQLAAELAADGIIDAATYAEIIDLFELTNGWTW